MQTPILTPVNFDSEILIPLGPYYVIETDSDPCFVTDVLGKPKRFEKLKDAVEECRDWEERYIVAFRY